VPGPAPWPWFQTQGVHGAPPASANNPAFPQTGTGPSEHRAFYRHYKKKKLLDRQPVIIVEETVALDLSWDGTWLALAPWHIQGALYHRAPDPNPPKGHGFKPREVGKLLCTSGSHYGCSAEGAGRHRASPWQLHVGWEERTLRGGGLHRGDPASSPSVLSMQTGPP
jgi:hypothetical protein